MFCRVAVCISVKDAIKPVVIRHLVSQVSDLNGVSDINIGHDDI
jgi:hypothetical protein